MRWVDLNNDGQPELLTGKLPQEAADLASSALPWLVAAAFVQRFDGPADDLIMPIEHTLATSGALRPGASYDLITASVPGAALVTLDGIGHMVPWEAPEAFVRAIDGPP